MPTLGILGKYKLKLHRRDHNPPHVHFEARGVEVRIDIDECAVMSVKGKPTRKEIRFMLAYVDAHQEILRKAWNETQD